MIWVTPKVSYAQQNVGIGTSSPDPSAKLDISTAADAATQKKGLLVPQISLTTTTDGSAFAGLSPVGPANGLLVYNTNSGITGTGAASTGFYYNSGTKGSPVWKKVADNVSKDWLKANDATLPSAITSDNQYVTGKVGIGSFSATNPLQELDVKGRMRIENGVIQNGTTAITGTSDLGLYSLTSGAWIRIVSNGAPIKFFTDQGGTTGTGTNATMAVDNANGGGVMIAAETGGTGNAGSPNPKAALEITSTTKGLLPPRLTTAQRDAMGNTLAQGLTIFNITNNCLEFWDTKATPAGGNGFWNSLCKWCENVVIINSNQSGYNLNSALGGAKAEKYCVYINSGVTLQASAAGGDGFNASSMPTGSEIILYNYGNILAGGGNGGAGSRESDGVCAGDICPSAGQAGGNAINTNSSVPITVYNYGLVRAGGGGGGGGGTGCCAASGGGGGGAGTPAGGGGSGQTSSCVQNFGCVSCSRNATSQAGNVTTAPTATTGGSGGSGSNSGNTGCPSCNGTGAQNGGSGGAPGVAGNAGGSSGNTTACSNGAGASGGAAGLALQGNGSGSSLSNISGTVTGSVNP